MSQLTSFLMVKKINAFLLRLEQDKNIFMLLFKITMGVLSIDDNGGDDNDDDKLKATTLEKKLIKAPYSELT